MRRKTFRYKAAAAIIAAALTISSAPAVGNMAVYADQTQTEDTEKTTKTPAEALAESIAKAEALQEQNYTKASWDSNKTDVDTALVAAKKVDTATASEEDITAADTALTTALAKLVEAGDQTELKEVLAQAEALNENDYTEKSWDYLAKYIKQAKENIEARETASTLKRTKNNIAFSMGRLVAAYEKDSLQAMIAEAEGLDKTDYTAESWKTASKKIQAAINTANEKITSRGTKDAVHQAKEALIEAMDELQVAQVTVGRGSFEKKLTPGTYSLPIELLNGGKADSTKDYTSANYMSVTSMAGGCFPDNATLVIHEDGSATLTTAAQAISAMGMSDAASDWTVYENTQDYLNGTASADVGNRFKVRVDETKTVNGKKKPSKFSFTIPDLKQNVVAVRMYISVMSINQDACIGLDWTNIEKVSDDTTVTSDVEKTYAVEDDKQVKFTELREGKTVSLSEDTELTSDLYLKGGTIDLNGHTLAQKDNLITVAGNVNIIDSSADKTGKITAEEYFSGTDTESTITMAKGSLTMTDVTLDGQVGNRVRIDDSLCRCDLPDFAVTLDHCTLTNQITYSGSGYAKTGSCAVKFEYLENGGITFTMKNCTVSSEKKTRIVSVSDLQKGKVSITDSNIQGNLSIYGSDVTVTGTTAEGLLGNDITAKNAVQVKDDTFTSLDFTTYVDTTLENIKAAKASNTNKGALALSGTGTVTIKDGVYDGGEKEGLAVEGTPAMIKGGYFKGEAGAVTGPYETPEGMIIKEVTDGEYAGYSTVAEGKEEEDPSAVYVAQIYNEDGSVARKIKEDNAALLLAYAKNGQTVKLDADVTLGEDEGMNTYKNVTLDLNGHTLNAAQITGMGGVCRIVDSSADKSGKMVSNYGFAGQTAEATMIFDAIQLETPCIAAMSIGKVYIINGTKVSGAGHLTAVMGAGPSYIYESTWSDFPETNLMGQKIEDPKALLEGAVRTAQYDITANEDGSYIVSANDLGKQMRAFEEIDADLYTEASYQAAKAIYDDIDATADEDVTEEMKAEFTTSLKNAVAALKEAASEEEVQELNEAITAAKAFVESEYTADSFKKVSEAITAAETAVEGKDKEEVAAAKSALAQAVAALVKAPKKEENTNGGTNNGGSNDSTNNGGNNGSTTTPTDNGNNTITQTDTENNNKPQVKVAKVSGVKAINSKKKAVVIRWKKVSGVNGYEVYRSNKKKGKYQKLTTLKKAGKITYTDKKVTKKKTYYYKVRAYKVVDGKKVYGSYSTVKKVKIKK